MKNELKILIGVGVIITLLVLLGAIFLGNYTTPTTQNAKADPTILIRKDSATISTSSASVTLVEFGDYQCPACGSVYHLVKQLLDEEKDKLTFVFRNFPLSIHPNARPAAEAAEAAGEQGKFWQMHDKLFEAQTEWSESTKSPDIFVKYAKELGLDTEKFKKSVESLKFQDKINRDVNDGTTLGINSTPTFYINGNKLENLASYDDLKKAVESLAKKK